MDAIQERLAKTEEKMKKSIAALDNEYKSIRAGRATPAILDKLTVEYYGAPTKIDQMAAISVPEARLMVIQPWDPTTLNAIQRAILASDLGLNPANDGKVLRIAFPPLTEERRREISKDVAKYAEECKVAIRSLRRDANDKLKTLKKNAEITDLIFLCFLENVCNAEKRWTFRRRREEISRFFLKNSGGKKVWHRIVFCRSISESSWMETGAGRKSADCRDRPVIKSVQARFRRSHVIAIRLAFGI